MDTETIVKRKVFGVPMLYLIGGFVLVLAIVAWRMKSSADLGPADGATPEEEGSDTLAGTIGGDVYPNMPTGTVISAPASTDPGAPPPASTPAPDASYEDVAAYEDNSTWMRKAVAYLIANGTNPGDAQAAIQHYLSGGDLTYAEGALRDKVVRQFGLPPDIGDVGSTAKQVVTTSAPKPVVPKPVAVKPKPVAIAKPAPPKPAAPAAYARPYPGHLIKSGSTGHDVTLVQHVVGVPTDGKFGPITKAAVIRWQKSHGLSGDGIVGPLTWRKMFG